MFVRRLTSRMSSPLDLMGVSRVHRDLIPQSPQPLPVSFSGTYPLHVFRIQVPTSLPMNSRGVRVSWDPASNLDRYANGFSASGLLTAIPRLLDGRYMMELDGKEVTEAGGIVRLFLGVEENRVQARPELANLAAFVIS